MFFYNKSTKDFVDDFVMLHEVDKENKNIENEKNMKLNTKVKVSINTSIGDNVIIKGNMADTKSIVLEKVKEIKL